MACNVNPLLHKNIPPTPLKEGTNLREQWCAWKKDFISFLKLEDPNESFKDSWENYMLMFIGPVGRKVYQEISKNTSNKDLNALFEKFDIYFIFNEKRRFSFGSIENYVNSLKEIAEGSGHSNVSHIVKQKIIQDILMEKFTGRAKTFLSSIQLELKTLDEIISIWKHCEKLMFEDGQLKQTQENNENTSTECIRCGSQHARNKCPAHGKQCDKCKKFNHFTENCKVQYVHNCPKCGSDHVQSCCIAFGKTCTKCGKSNHFSSKCNIPFVKDCLRCGTDHLKNDCPAEGKLCHKCNKPNHFANKCITKTT